MYNRVYGQHDIRRLINNCGSITRADAQCRCAAGICSLNHAGTARCKDDIRLFHYKVCKLKAGHVNPSDDTPGCACSDSRLKHNLCSLDSGLLGSGMGADNDAVSCLKRNKGFKNCSRRGIGRRNNRSDNADRLRNFLYSERSVVFKNSAGFCILISIVNILCCIMIFNNLILYDTHTRFSNSHFGKRNSRLVCSGCRGKKNLVNLFLSVSRKFFLRFSKLGKCFFKRFDIFYYCVIFSHLKISSRFSFTLLFYYILCKNVAVNFTYQYNIIDI